VVGLGWNVDRSDVTRDANVTRQDERVVAVVGVAFMSLVGLVFGLISPYMYLAGYSIAILQWRGSFGYQGMRCSLSRRIASTVSGNRVVWVGAIAAATAAVALAVTGSVFVTGFMRAYPDSGWVSPLVMGLLFATTAGGCALVMARSPALPE
jgi:hypothetical protein